jgi:uncharacterized LabA/DUF88 family protein
MEEKQTDVNISLQMYRDVVRGHCDSVVLCSNDSDLEPAMRLIREDFPEKVVGLVLPRNQNGRKSGKLQRHAHWTRQHIRDEELADCQFPDRILDHRNRTIHKPEQW